MININTSGVEIIPTNEKENGLSTYLTNQIVDFTKKHYHIKQTQDFIQTTLKPNYEGSIILFCNKAGELVGFTRLFHHKMQIKNKHFTVFYTISLHNILYNISTISARTCLTEAMKHKLRRPEKNIVFFSCVTGPKHYELLADLNESVFPRPNKETPELAFRLLNKLKKNHRFDSNVDAFWLIKNLPRRNDNSEIVDKSNSLQTFFQSINPGFTYGEGLLLYMPLTIMTIGQGLRYLVGKNSHQKSNHTTECA